MKTWVVDASVIVASFFDEDCSLQALKLLSSEDQLCAPDLVHTEAANAIWKRYKKGEIEHDESLKLFADSLALRLTIIASNELLLSALELALRTRRTVYDCLYLALAIRLDAVLATADQKLVNALSAGPFKQRVCWIGGFS